MVVEQIKKNIQRVAPLPTNVRRIMELVNDSDADMRELAKVVEQDPTLTMQALNLCNSAYYSLPVKVASVSHAVRFLGTETVGGLAMAAYFRGLMMQQGKNKSNPWLEEAGNHLFLTAQIAEKLARAAGGHASPSAVFTAGLLHDVGKLVFSKLDFSYAGKIGELVLNGEMPPIDAEREVLGTDHTEVGARLAERWKVPAEIVDGIEKHHSPLSTEAPLPNYVFLADSLFYLLKQDLDLDAFLSRAGIFQAMETGGLTDSHVREAVDAFQS
jgi:putative nucleotidyltransferase with HDIG domain